MNWSLDAPVTYPRHPGAGSFPGPTAVADVTGDGRNDVLTTASIGSSYWLLVYPQTESGTLGGSMAYEMDGGPSGWDGGIATGDLDGDGLQDVVVSSSTSLSVFFSLRSGGMRRIVLSSHGTTWSKVAVVDSDFDGQPDIFSLSNQPSYIGNNRSGGIWRNRQASFAGPFGFSISNRFRLELEVADVTGDGKRDLIHISELYPRVTVHRATLSDYGTWNEYSHPNPGALYVALGAGDFNGDGRRDVAAAYSLAQNLSRVVIYHQIAPPLSNLTMGPELMAPQYTGTLIGGDIDNDGDDDLLLVPQPRNEPMRLYRQQGGALPSNPESIPGTSGNDLMNTESAAMADVNSDGCKDIVVATGMQGVVVWYGRNCARRRLTGGNQLPIRR